MYCTDFHIFADSFFAALNEVFKSRKHVQICCLHFTLPQIKIANKRFSFFIKLKRIIITTTTTTTTTTTFQWLLRGSNLPICQLHVQIKYLDKLACNVVPALRSKLRKFIYNIENISQNLFSIQPSGVAAQE